MKQIRPDYYDHFSCTADQCPITCCQEWKISVDDHTNNCWKKLAPPADTIPAKTRLSDRHGPETPLPISLRK